MQLPNKGEYLTGIFGIGRSDVLTRDEKQLQKDDILVQTIKVVKTGQWPIEGTVSEELDNTLDIHQRMFFDSTNGLSGVYLNENRPFICFPYENTAHNNNIDKNMQRDELVKSISVNNDVFLVDDYELRRCDHPSEHRQVVQTSQAASLGIRILPVGGNASLSGEKAFHCKKCDSVWEIKKDDSGISDLLR